MAQARFMQVVPQSDVFGAGQEDERHAQGCNAVTSVRFLVSHDNARALLPYRPFSHERYSRPGRVPAARLNICTTSSRVVTDPAVAALLKSLEKNDMGSFITG